jgi:hypothetical protein
LDGTGWSAITIALARRRAYRNAKKSVQNFQSRAAYQHRYADTPIHRGGGRSLRVLVGQSPFSTAVGVQPQSKQSGVRRPLCAPAFINKMDYVGADEMSVKHS